MGGSRVAITRRMWLVAAGYATVVAVGLVVQPSVALRGLALWLAVVLGSLVVAAVALLVLLARRQMRVLVPGLVVVGGLLVLVDATFVGIVLLFELLFATTMYGSPGWRVTAWTVSGIVDLALVAVTLARSRENLDLALVNITVSILAVWWAQHIGRLEQRVSREEARATALALVAVRECELADAKSALAVEAERVQVARDLHDLVAGRLSAIFLQASLTRDALEAGRGAVELVDAIRWCSEVTLRETRDMIERMSSGAVADATALADAARRQFCHTLDVARSLEVDVVIQDDLSPEWELASAVLYMVGQEAVVNMIAHAAPCTATVVLSSSDDAIRLHARNSVSVGRSGSPAGPRSGRSSGRRGHGLRNMSSRLAPLNGTLTFGPDPVVADRSWTVTATIPASAIMVETMASVC
ncbi:MAG: sensor histidine kinase [Dermatophilaceae bacterium]